MRTKILLMLVVLVPLFVTNISAQTISRMLTSGCVGGENVFVFSRSDCGVSWVISGNYTILSQSSNVLRVKWNAANSSISVSANYSGCSSAPYSGSVYYPPFSVTATPVATISPSGTKTICTTCSVPLIASPSGAGFSFVWYKDNVINPSKTTNTYGTSDPGVYKVDVTATSSGCYATSAPTTVRYNVPPAVSAGTDQVITFPQTSITLSGTASDSDGTITAFGWTKVSGANAVMQPTGYNVNITGLEIGEYTFRFSASDAFESRVSDVKVTVDYPPDRQNYIRTVTLNVPVTNENTIAQLPIGDKSEKWEYFDELGRLSQTVLTQGSGLLAGTAVKKDIVQPVVYDGNNRVVNSYLPFAAESSGYKKMNIIDANGSFAGVAQNFYNTPADKIAIDVNPVAKTIVEESALNRVLKQGSAGAAWQPNNSPYTNPTDNTVAMNYGANAQNEVIRWTYTSPTTDNPNGTLTGSSPLIYYAPNTLRKKQVKDENHKEIIEFSDSYGRTVLKRVQASATLWADTYYVYDLMGNLVLVLSPEAVSNILSN